MEIERVLFTPDGTHISFFDDQKEIMSINKNIFKQILKELGVQFLE